jgi:hypothetical protein
MEETRCRHRREMWALEDINTAFYCVVEEIMD